MITPQVIDAPTQAEVNDSGMIIQNLKAGEEIQSYDTRRPNVNYATFHDSIMKGMTSAEGYAQSVVSVTFNSNYSAHRGELLLTWNKVEIEREQENADLNNPVFRQWLQEMVRTGILPELNNFNSSPYIANAWCKADWIGFPKLDIDPKATVEAAAMRVKEGFSTRDRETAGINGSEFTDNAKKLKKENDLLWEANKYLVETSVRGSAKPPVSASETETETDDDEEDETKDED
jgi:capsid protein